jgi:hypothetical protein
VEEVPSGCIRPVWSTRGEYSKRERDMNKWGLYIGEGLSTPAAERLFFPSHLGMARTVGTGECGESDRVDVASRSRLASAEPR